MQALVKFTLTLAVFFAGGSVAFAEGGCPAGQYPVGGQGVQGCAPIPSAGSGGGDLRPNGRWTKTWGAISISPSTLDVGTSVGQKSKAAAFAEAKARCSTYGAKDCGENFSYKNQCVAVAAPAGGRRGGCIIRPQRPKSLPLSERHKPVNKVVAQATRVQCLTLIVLSQHFIAIELAAKSQFVSSGVFGESVGKIALRRAVRADRSLLRKPASAASICLMMEIV
ncbi:DUF4189 domain-containing protein [Stenotrophomonas indicatrix]|uniref:DUF4189 domain-containing protein n=1 Tax=Stenotrophomonas indicatrix TaxID=2045451 RepID=UPI003207F1FD